MKSITEIKNQVSKRYGYDSWNALLEDYVFVPNKVDIETIINESILEYAKQCKEAQRKSDAKAAKLKVSSLDATEYRVLEVFTSTLGTVVQIDPDSILNNPLVTDKID